MRDANVTFINTTITLTASTNRFELNDSSVFSPTTSTSHEHVKGWRISEILAVKMNPMDPLNSIELHPPPNRPFRDPENLFLRIFVSTLCDFTHFLQDLERGVRNSERARRTATSAHGDDKPSQHEHTSCHNKKKSKLQPFFPKLS
jgi:hypothetical protein